MRRKRRQYVLGQFLQHLGRRALRELDAQRSMVHAGTLPLAQQIDQSVAAGSQRVAAIERRAGMVTERHPTINMRVDASSALVALSCDRIDIVMVSASISA